MTTSIGEALPLVAVMAAAIFFCRIFPFLFFRGKNGGMNNATSTPENAANLKVELSQKRRNSFLSFVEKTVPPVAMTVLAFNSLAGPVQASSHNLIPTFGAAAFTAIVHVWRRNPLMSIFGGTALYMILIRILPVIS
jgi:branched-subunit amino acid transport protein AzlD